MKRILGAAAAMAAAMSCGSASAATLVTSDTWRGSIVVTAITPACNQPGFPEVNQTLISVFRPRLNASQPNTALLITFANGALLGTVASTATVPPVNGNYTGDMLGGLATYVRYTASYSITVTPASITAATPQITLKGMIKNFRNTANCNVTFQGSFFKGI